MDDMKLELLPAVGGRLIVDGVFIGTVESADGILILKTWGPSWRWLGLDTFRSQARCEPVKALECAGAALMVAGEETASAAELLKRDRTAYGDAIRVHLAKADALLAASKVWQRLSGMDG